MKGYEWSRRYPPLAVLIVALVVAIFELPSALNVAQTAPGQTLEYAPISGDRGAAPPGGNLAALGLGQTGTGPGGQGFGGVLPGVAGTLPGASANPSNKRCVGNPPRQTEDLLSPPCVGFFQGDNGGTTYRGVTRSEVTVLFYFEGGVTDGPSSQGVVTEPTSTYFDLGKPPDPNKAETPWTRMLRVAQTDFNDRYQTYGRQVHFWVYFSSGSSAPNARRADAVDNVAKVNPLAVVSFVYQDQQDYLSAIAEHGCSPSPVTR